jgi:hypothetical protein
MFGPDPKDETIAILREQLAKAQEQNAELQKMLLALTDPQAHAARAAERAREWMMTAARPTPQGGDQKPPPTPLQSIRVQPPILFPSARPGSRAEFEQGFAYTEEELKELSGEK